MECCALMINIKLMGKDGKKYRLTVTESCSCTNINKEGNYQHDDSQLQLGVLYRIQ